MPSPVSQTVFLLPERRRFQGQRLSDVMAVRLAQSDRMSDAAAGEQQQLLRYFDLVPRGWPMAAITRQFDSGDAGHQLWLRADPVHVRPDMGGARLLAWGNLQIAAEEAQEFLRPLKPLFGDAGFVFSCPAPERWYLTLPREAKLPAFAVPSEALGEDLLKHLPQGPEGRRWQMLLTEAQVLLHNHPRNAARIARGLLPVNSLWFWGGGVIPATVRSSIGLLESDDPELCALAALVVERGKSDEKDLCMVDLRSQRNWLQVEAAMAGDRVRCILDFADGARWRIAAGQRWRFWRRPLQTIA